jgi:hypothetical protein
MAILRCNHCGHLAEVADTSANQTVACPKCPQQAKIYPTLFFIERLLDKYFAAQREVIRLKALVAPSPTTVAATPATAALAQPDLDLSNTDHLANELQHGPIYDWFRKKQISVQADMRSVDTSGFYDEVAEAIGDNLDLFKEVVERIRWSQQKDYASTTIHLEKKTADEAAQLSRFCQQLYDFSFVAKCFHNKPEQNIRLILQTAPSIRQFFNGEWLEWFALMRVLRYAKERGRRFSCARGLEIALQNGDKAELDVFMLLDGNLPICIECKSGDCRPHIDRALALRKRLGLEARQFVMCVAGLSDEQAKAYTAMYELTFVNERSLATHLQKLF